MLPILLNYKEVITFPLPLVPSVLFISIYYCGHATTNVKRTLLQLHFNLLAVAEPFFFLCSLGKCKTMRKNIRHSCFRISCLKKKCSTGFLFVEKSREELCYRGSLKVLNDTKFIWDQFSIFRGSLHYSLNKKLVKHFCL